MTTRGNKNPQQAGIDLCRTDNTGITTTIIVVTTTNRELPLEG
jgi:hypothetical protein